MLNAKAITQRVQSGVLSASEAIALGDAAIEAREERLSVFTHRADNPRPGEGPLAGIAVGVKDIIDTADMPTQYHSPIYDSFRPLADAAIVTMLRERGATITGKTVTTEYAWFHPGATRNPHNEDHTPGGSSSGSAAGVAAGFFPAAIGSQTGGSVIRPAAFCGVSGYKPSFRLFPTIGMKCFSWSLDTTGFFAASALDVGFFAATLSGRDLEPGDIPPPRIGLYRSPIDNMASADMTEAWQNAARVARDAGAQVIDIEADPAVEAAREAHSPIQDFEARIALGWERRNHGDRLSPKLRDYLEAAASVSPDAYDEARRTANRARKATRDLFRDVDVLLLPSAPGIAPKSLESTGDSVFNRLWTPMGLPCVNITGLADENGMPLGLQVIAPFGADKAALEAAHWLERQMGVGG